MSTQTLFVTLYKEECCNCGIIFGMTQESVNRFRGDSSLWFHCPNGHKQHYTESEADRLKRQVAQLQTTVEHKDARINTLRESNAFLERSRSATRAAHTRTCNRVKHGVCPCCNRTFQNLLNHMATKHPDFRTAEKAP